MKAPVRMRLWIAAGLAVCAVALLTALFLTGRAGSRGKGIPPAARGPSAAGRTIEGCVDAVAAAFNVPRDAMRSRTVADGSAKVAERVIRVSPEFSTYEFHSALLGEVSGLDATMSATENPKEKTVTLQIMRNGATAMRVVLDLRPPPQHPRKESSH